MGKGQSPTQRTLRALRSQGFKCAIVEKWNQYAGPKGCRVDLFGIIDIIALDYARGVIGVQSTGTSFSSHFHKLTVEKAQDSYDWLSTPGTHLELWSWRKVKAKRGGKAMVWASRVVPITLADLKTAETAPSGKAKTEGAAPTNPAHSGGPSPEAQAQGLLGEDGFLAGNLIDSK